MRRITRSCSEGPPKQRRRPSDGGDVTTPLVYRHTQDGYKSINSYVRAEAGRPAGAATYRSPAARTKQFSVVIVSKTPPHTLITYLVMRRNRNDNIPPQKHRGVAIPRDIVTSYNLSKTGKYSKKDKDTGETYTLNIPKHGRPAAARQSHPLPHFRKLMEESMHKAK